MRTTRTTPLAPFFSAMAILSFKKKGKGGDSENLSSMGTADLSAENLALSGLGGDLGDLNKLDGINDGSFPASGPTAEGKKFQEMEASVNDLKKHAEATDLNSRATRGEIENMKKDLSQINDSIKSLLNVYEAVSRQYNPFVEGDVPVPTVTKIAGLKNAPATGAAQNDDDISIGSLSKMTEPPTKESGADGPFDDSPLDRIIKPDDVEEPEELRLEGNNNLETEQPPGPQMNEPEVKQNVMVEPKATPPVPVKKTMYEDTYILEQVHKLVDHQMSKICKMRFMGEEPDALDIKTLEVWMGEFKRLGGC